MEDWSWLWYLSNYWRLHLHKCACWKLDSVHLDGTCGNNMVQERCHQPHPKSSHIHLRPSFSVPLCCASPLSSVRLLQKACWDDPTWPWTSGYRRQSLRLPTAAVIQWNLESNLLKHGFTSFLLFLQFSSQCNILGSVCVCCCILSDMRLEPTTARLKRMNLTC